MTLTAAQQTAFERDGYLVVENVLDEETVLRPIEAEYDALLNRLYAEWVAEGRLEPPEAGSRFEERLVAAYRAGCDWFQPMDISLPGDQISADTPMHFGPAVFGLVTAPKLLDLVEGFVGPEISSNPIQHVRLKPPSLDLHNTETRAHITATHWHQDRGVTHVEADNTRMVTVWCAITDASEENGCLQVVKGGHKGGLLPHGVETQPFISNDNLDQSAITPLPVKRGSVIFFHPLVPHASLPNLSNGIRWSFDIRYHRTGEPSGRSHFPEFVARSGAAPENVLTDWQEWQHLWEDARARLAETPHIDIHRWSKQKVGTAKIEG